MTLEGKVAHGLVRGSDRFSVRVVVDHTLTRCDAGVVVNGSPAGIPVVATVADALRHAPEAPRSHWSPSPPARSPCAAP
jgi:uncharacterized NAD-dependent epimerase/dehydratase family protein